MNTKNVPSEIRLWISFFLCVLSSCVLSVLFSLVPLEVYARSELLIDFSGYEDRIRDENLYVVDNEEFRRRAFESEESIEEKILYRSFFLPYFQVSQSDMQLDRWLIQEHNGKSWFARKKPTPFEREKEIDSSFLAFDVVFEQKLSFFKERNQEGNRRRISSQRDPRQGDSSKTENPSLFVLPPYSLYAWDKTGQLAKPSNGVLQNVGEKKEFTIRIGLGGGDADSLFLYLELEDHKQRKYSYPMGFLSANFSLDSSRDSSSRIYSDYDGKQFQVQDRIASEPGTGTYFKVYKPSNWSMYRDGKELYREFLLRWTNSKYLDPRNRILKQRPSYPSPVPYLVLKGFKIENRSRKAQKVSVWIKEVRADLDPYWIDYEEPFLEDEKEWEILKARYLVQRKKQESMHAFQIWQKFVQGRKLGFFRYSDFLKFYFLRYP